MVHKIVDDHHPELLGEIAIREQMGGRLRCNAAERANWVACDAPDRQVVSHEAALAGSKPKERLGSWRCHGGPYECFDRTAPSNWHRYADLVV